MARKLTFKRQSEDEEIKQAGLNLDFDELAKAGSMSSVDASIAKWYGIYRSRQPGSHMARVVIPGGVVTSYQAKNIAEISKRYGQGIVNVTTRQALQFHWLKLGNLADMTRELDRAGSSTMHGCGDVTRNVAACPLAQDCVYKRFDVLPYAVKTSEYLGACRDLDDLPRKYKITYSGCGASCAQAYMNCVGMIAVNLKDQPGFKIVIGGGMGWKAFVAEPLFGFVPAVRAIEATRAIALLFREHGDRFNRAKSRLKFVVHRLGIDECRQIVLANLKVEGVDSSDFIVDDIVDEGPAYPPRPLTQEPPCVEGPGQTVRVIVPKGELSFTQLHRLAELSELYANQRVYTTNRQNVELKGILSQDVAALEKEIAALGLSSSGSFGLRDIVTCVGTTYCPKAVSETRALYDQLHELVSGDQYKSIEKSAIINITGCPNSCSPYRISDIGFRGMRIREMEGSVEGYEILLGGSERQHGVKLGEFKLTDCAGVTRIVLDTFLAIKNENELLTDCLNRVGIDHFKKEVFGEI